MSDSEQERRSDEVEIVPAEQPASTPRRPWDDVVEHVTRLGRLLRDRLRLQQPAERPSAGEDAQQGLRQAVDAVDAAFTKLGDALRDADVQGEAGETARAVGRALAATFTEVGDELRRRFDRDQPPKE